MIELDVHTRDEEYLDLLNRWVWRGRVGQAAFKCNCVLNYSLINCRGFPKSLDTFQPDIVVYNAGTDVLIGDSLGRLDITPEVRMRGGSCYEAENEAMCTLYLL